MRHTPFVLLTFFSLAPSLAAQCEDPPEAVLQPSQSILGDFYGRAVAIGDGWVFVAGDSDDVVGLDSGSVTVFQEQAGTWVETQYLQPDDPGVNHEFGAALAYDDGTLVVGAPGRSQQRGAVYVFELQAGAWIQTQRVHGPGTIVGERFGTHVDLSKDLHVMAAGGLEGEVELFTDYSGSWLHHQTLVYPGAGTGEGFGSDFAIIDSESDYGWGDLEIIVGAPGDTPPGKPAGSGSVWLFERFCNCEVADWTPSEALSPPAPYVEQGFGTGVDLMNTSTLHDGILPSFVVTDGARDIFVHSYSAPFIELVSTHSYFPGQPGSVAGVDGVGDTFVVSGSRGDGSDGAVHVYKRGMLGWVLHDTLTAEVLGGPSAFGVSSALATGRVVTGAVYVDDFRGAATIHTLDVGPNYSYCDAAANSGLLEGTHLERVGSTSIAQNQLVFRANGPKNQTALLFYGPGQQQAPFGDGTLCVGQPFSRVSVATFTTASSADAFGALSIHFDLTQPPANGGPGAIQAGSRWNFQLWFRDPAFGGAGYNLSDGASLLFCP